MLAIYLLALVGLFVLLGAGLLAVAALFAEADTHEPDPYQASLEAADRIQAEAWTAIQRLHDLRVVGASTNNIHTPE